MTSEIPFAGEQFSAAVAERQFTLSYRLLPPNRRKAAQTLASRGWRRRPSALHGMACAHPPPVKSPSGLISLSRIRDAARGPSPWAKEDPGRAGRDLDATEFAD
jgi:hypothetical protein